MAREKMLRIVHPSNDKNVISVAKAAFDVTYSKLGWEIVGTKAPRPVPSDDNTGGVDAPFTSRTSRRSPVPSDYPTATNEDL